MKKSELQKILFNGGATLNASGVAVSFRRGYQVSRKDCYTLPASNVGAILCAVNHLLSHSKRGDFVGLWVDSGLCYIDISERINSRKKALKLGKERKQKSVFNWKTGGCLPCME